MKFQANLLIITIVFEILRTLKGNTVDGDCESCVNVKMEIQSDEEFDVHCSTEANTTLQLKIKKEASICPKLCVGNQKLSDLKYEYAEEVVANDYLFEYGTNTTFPIKMKEEAPASEKFIIGEQAPIDLQAKYEYEEEIVTSDSGTSMRYTSIIDEKFCRFCRIKFRFATHYEKHFNDHHPEEISYACPCCPFAMHKRQTFLCHFKTEHPDQIILPRKCKSKQVYKCESCLTNYRGVREFENHILSRHKGMKMIKCTLCNAKFSWFGSLTRHETEKHGMHDAEFLCKFCKNAFLRSDDLEAHVGKCEERQTMRKTGTHQINTGKYELRDDYKTCEECGDKFDNVPLLRMHLKCAHPESKRRYVCVVCQKSFTKFHTLEKHIDKLHPDEGVHIKINRKRQKYECQYCGEEFRGLGFYEAHGMTAHGEEQKLFFCPECGGGFNRKARLQSHFFVMHTPPTIPCNICKKLFPTLGRKNVHEKYCGNTRCDVCNREFSSKSSLQCHVMRKHGIASKPCQHCCKYFATTSDLKQHERMCGKRSAEESPSFFCDICQKIFRGSARWHYSHHEDYDYCHFCHQRFHRVKNPEGFSNHMAKRHPDEVNNYSGLIPETA